MLIRDYVRVFLVLNYRRRLGHGIRSSVTHQFFCHVTHNSNSATQHRPPAPPHKCANTDTDTGIKRRVRSRSASAIQNPSCHIRWPKIPSSSNSTVIAHQVNGSSTAQPHATCTISFEPFTCQDLSGANLRHPRLEC